MLLEQFEAQIFSIIRQNMKVSESQAQSAVMVKVLELIERYITLPICKDEVTIGKVRDILLQGLTEEPASIYRNNYSASETVVLANHLNKLQLLSKLLNFSWHGRDILETEQANSAAKRKLDASLPSKF